MGELVMSEARVAYVKGIGGEADDTEGWESSVTWVSWLDWTLTFCHLVMW